MNKHPLIANPNNESDISTILYGDLALWEAPMQNDPHDIHLHQ